MHSLLKQRQLGLSLVELMIAIALATLLMLGITQVFLSSKVTYSRNQELSEIQESGRFALELLAQDIANTAYQGQCYREEIPPRLNAEQYKQLCSVDLKVFNYTSPACLPRQHINAGEEAVVRHIWSLDEGALFGWAKAAVPSFVKKPVKGQGLFMQFAAGGSERFHGASSNAIDGQQINWDTTGNLFSPLQNGDVALIADGAGCDVFKNTVGSISAENNYIQKDSSLPWTSHYSKDFEILKFNSLAYYVADDQGTPALYRQAFDYDLKTISTEALIPGVAAMKLEYGLIKGASANVSISEYVSADQVKDWEAVKSVRVTLTVRAASGLEKDFSTLVILRNRL